MMSTELDGLLIKFYESIGNDRDLIDFVLNYDILRSAVAGISNSKIATIFDVSETHVKELLERFLGFDGYSRDLDLDIYNLYKRFNGDFTALATEATLMSSVITADDLKVAFDVCEKFDQLERRLLKKWK